MGDITAKRCSVQLGKGLKYGFTTTNSIVYPDSDAHKTIQQPNKDFIHTIKSSHFDVGNARGRSHNQIQQHYMSANNLTFNHKGNAMKIKAVLDERKKEDLRRNHFGIGGPTADFKHPMSTLQYRPGTAVQRQSARPSLTAEKKRDLRASHWSVGQVTPKNFATIEANSSRNMMTSQTMQVDNRRTAAG